MYFNRTLALAAMPSLIIYFWILLPGLTVANWGTSRLDEISENSARHRYRKIC